MDAGRTFLELPLSGATLVRPVAVAANGDGDTLAIADVGQDEIVEAAVGGSVVALFGNGVAGYRDGPGSLAEFNDPLGLAFDQSGDVFVADATHLRRVDVDGGVTTLAGNGAIESVDGTAGPWGGASILWALSVWASGDGGVVFFTDADSVRELSGGLVTTLVRAADPNTMSLDGKGDFLLWSGLSLQIATAGGSISTLAGGEAPGYVDGLASLDGGTRFNAYFAFAQITTCPDGEIYLADPGNNSIRAVSPSGEVSTLVGDGPDCWLDGGPGSGTLDHPLGVACDGQGVIYIADTGHARILVARP
ncbi:MAG: NHL repeat-containing protein [Myxococcales bacterium]